MKHIFLLFIVFCSYSCLSAQYDFPVIINGLSIGLDLDGSRVVYPQDWLKKDIGDCWPDTLLISRTIFPRDSVPPSSAADSLVFTCDDFSSESIEIWWKGQANEWLVTDSYALINGFENCNCNQECGQATTPILLNGLSTAYGNGDSLQLHAKALVAVAFSETTYSFSADPNDSLHTFYCTDGPAVNVQIFAHRAGYSSLAAQTYIAFSSESCGSMIEQVPAPTVIQGLSVPSGPEGVVTIPARAFANPYDQPQQLSFSNDPLDTLFSIDCSAIGFGGINCNLFRHINGQVSVAVPSYLVGDNGRRFCNQNTLPSAPNDDLDQATILDFCEHYGQFSIATSQPNEPLAPLTDTSSGSLWYKLPRNEEQDDDIQITIRPVDSIYYAIYPALEDFNNPMVPYVSGLLTADTTIELCWPLASLSHWSLQIQQRRPNQISRYYLQLNKTVCLSNLPQVMPNEVAILKIFPNPSTGNITLSLSEEPLPPTSQIRIFSTSGQLVAAPNNPSFQLDHLTKGLYWVVVQLDDGQRLVQKLIKL